MNTKPYCRAAFSQIDITPSFQTELIGCYRPDSKSQGVLHPLYAQVLLLEYRGAYDALIAIDSLGLTTTLSTELRALVAAELGTDLAHVMLCFSHTHSAPSPLSPVNGERYFHLLCDRVVTCAAQAREDLRPCQAGWAMGHTALGENRREGCTTVDDRLGALQLTDAATGQPLAVVLRVTAHANILMSTNNKISSDYFHAARQKLSTHFRCPVMLIQGAAGNVKPAGVDKAHGGSLPDLERIADILLDSARQLHFHMADVTRLQMYTRDLDYYSDVPTAAEAQRIADEAADLCGIDGTAWLAECARLRESGLATQCQTGSVHFFYLNDGCFCGLPEEIFCEIALQASSRVPAPYFFLSGYTDGCTGYLPHRQEWLTGGYEILYSYLQYYSFHGHVMPFRQDTADRIVDLVCTEWQHVLGTK